jgi:hypothetical protein
MTVSFDQEAGNCISILVPQSEPKGSACAKTLQQRRYVTTDQTAID